MMRRDGFTVCTFALLILFFSAAPSFATTDPNLVGLWHMDGDWMDASGNGNNGTPYNGATFSTNARVGSHAGSFDGVDDYIRVAHNTSFNFNGYSCEAWVYATALSASGDNTIIAKNIEQQNVVPFYLVYTGRQVFGDGKNGFGIGIWPSGGPWIGVASGEVPALNTWYHVVGTYDGTAFKIYVNGALKGTRTSTYVVPGNTSSIGIGRYSNSYPMPWNGLIDEVAIYKRALTADEINRSYNAGLGRIALWHMDGDWTDASGNGNNGTAYNGATFSTNARVGSQAGSFDGVSAYVNGTSYSLPSGNSPRAVSAWVKAGNGPQSRAILQYGTGSASLFQLFIDSSNRASVGTDSGSISGTSALSGNQWHYVVGVYEGSGTNTVRIYVDGVLENSGTITAPNTSNGTFTIGSFLTGGGYFNGFIDEVVVYNRAIATDEINKAYNDGLGRVGLWHMDGDWMDASGNGNNGTPYNGATFSTDARVGSLAGNFDGNDYIKVSHNAGLNFSAYSCEAWVYASALSLSEDNTIIAKNIEQQNVVPFYLVYTGRQVFGDGKNGFGIGIWPSGGPWIGVASGEVPALNTWYHVVGTYDGTAFKIYVNGALKGTRAATYAVPGNTSSIGIGRYSNTYPMQWNGLIDEAAVYKRALSADEILSNYNHLTTPAVTITSPPSGVSDNRTPVLSYTVSHGAVVVKVDGVVVNKVSGDALDSLQDGTHTIRVESVNDAGLTGFAEVSYTVQSSPMVTINPVTTPTNVSTQTIGGTRSLDAAVTVAVDTTAAAGIVSYPTASTWSCAISNLAEGTNGITVTATAPNNHASVAQTSITYYVLSISDVAVSTNTINTAASESASIFFTLNGPAAATLKIVPEKQGPTGSPVYQAAQTITGAGAYSFTWDGKDSTGKVVPDEAYLYILEATDGVKTALYSPAQPTGTGTVTSTQESSYNPYTNDPLTITYSVTQPARVDISIAWPTDPFNVMTSMPHAPGNYAFDWNGRDASGNMLGGGGKAYCYANRLLSENYIITTGDTPKLSGVKTDPYNVHLSYGEFTRIRYGLSRDANVTVTVISPSGSTTTVTGNQAQTAGTHEVQWNAVDSGDATGKKILVSEEGNYTVVIQATNAVSGASSTARANLTIGY